MDRRERLPRRHVQDDVVCRDDEGVRAGQAGREGVFAGLCHVAGVDVAEEVPATRLRIPGEGRLLRVVLDREDVGQAEPDEGDARPPRHLLRHGLGHHLRQRVGGVGQRVVVLVDGDVAHLVERKPQRGLAGGVDHPLEPQLPRRDEHVVVHGHVGVEGVRIGVDPVGRDVGQVDDSVRPGEHVHGLAELGQVRSVELAAVPGGPPGEVGGDDLVGGFDEVAEGGLAGFARGPGDDDAHGPSLVRRGHGRGRPDRGTPPSARVTSRAGPRTGRWRGSARRTTG